MALEPARAEIGPFQCPLSAPQRHVDALALADRRRARQLPPARLAQRVRRSACQRARDHVETGAQARARVACRERSIAQVEPLDHRETETRENQRDYECPPHPAGRRLQAPGEGCPGGRGRSAGGRRQGQEGAGLQARGPHTLRRIHPPAARQNLNPREPAQQPGEAPAATVPFFLVAKFQVVRGGAGKAETRRGRRRSPGAAASATPVHLIAAQPAAALAADVRANAAHCAGHPAHPDAARAQQGRWRAVDAGRGARRLAPAEHLIAHRPQAAQARLDDARRHAGDPPRIALAGTYGRTCRSPSLYWYESSVIVDTPVRPCIAPCWT